ncbi:MAG TPA: response regulator, partial [Rubricoccaceae bacterium]
MNGVNDVLVVDDNELDRELVRRFLPAGTPVREAATAAEARAHLAHAVPDLVLLDNRLPDANGVDLLLSFTELYVPVVMLTEVESPEVVVVAMKRGAEDYLVKGALTREGLAKALANAVEKSALRRRLREQHAALVEQADALEVRNGVGVVDAGRPGAAGVAEDTLVERAGRGPGRRQAPP